ncbi:HAD-IA family hydrolase [Kitasatospora sp. NPDC096147]|uniref:HAD-IA family hydrolase n=1 Tax=Kitasatospora sp. NPDC096147 TaxID=3364093 RepID=UPI00380C93F0
MSTTPHRAVLFDVDGVLLDSTEAHRRVWDAWSGLRGLDPARVWALTFGRRPEDTVRDAAGHLDPAAERLVLDRLLAEEGHAVPAVAGAAPLLAALSAGSWAVVTSGDAVAVRPRFAAAGLPLPTVQVYGSDVERAKPDPEGYLLAAARLGLAPGDCVVVEDAPAGVAAGKAAGCRVIGLTSTHRAEELGQADVLCGSLAEVRRRLGL